MYDEVFRPVKFTIKTPNAGVPPQFGDDQNAGCNASRQEVPSADDRRRAQRARQHLGSNKPEATYEVPVAVADAEQPEESTTSGRFNKINSFFHRRAERFDNNFQQTEADNSDAVTFEAAPRPPRWRGGWAFLGVVGLLGVFAWFAMGFQESLPLQRIAVEGANLLTKAEVIEIANIDRSRKFYDIDLTAIRQNLEKHTLIKAAYPRRESNPATIVLAIVEREPVALLHNETTNDNLLIDRDGFVLRPKLLTGLRNPSKLLEVPLLSGVTEKDTADYRAMVRLIHDIEFLDSGRILPLIGELKKNPSGSYIAYTTETQTPILLGSPADHPFIASLEKEHAERVRIDTSQFFVRQLALLAKAWYQDLEQKVRAHNVLYIDARFAGQIVVRERNHGMKAALASTERSDSTTAAAKRAPSSLIPDFVDASSGRVAQSVSKNPSPLGKGGDSRH